MDAKKVALQISANFCNNKAKIQQESDELTKKKGSHSLK